MMIESVLLICCLGLVRSNPSPSKLFFKDAVPSGIVTMKAGQSLTLDCEAAGSPIPTIHWLFDGILIPQGTKQHSEIDERLTTDLSLNGVGQSSLELGATKGRLFISCLTPEHQGAYTCVAETTLQRIVSTVVIEIDRKTNAGDDCLLVDRQGNEEPARIYMSSLQRLEFENADIHLFCRVEGRPKAKVTWYNNRDEEISRLDDKYSVLDNGDLIIRSINWADMGLFKCSANNGIGRDEASTFLYPTTP